MAVSFRVFFPRFQSPCMGMQSCAGTMISAGSAQQLQIKCDPTMGGTHTATLGLYGGGGYGSGGPTLATMTLVCTGTGMSGSGSSLWVRRRRNE